MAQTRPIETAHIGRVIKNDHGRILALYRLYLDSPSDSWRAIVDKILHRLASHLEKEERLF